MDYNLSKFPESELDCSRCGTCMRDAGPLVLRASCWRPSAGLALGPRPCGYCRVQDLRVPRLRQGWVLPV